MKKINVLFFGEFVDITGQSLINVNNVKDILELKKFLFKKYPNIKNKRFSISINKKLVNKNIELKNKDEVAILPPFAGG